jgi:hypothetical protein
MLVVFRRVEMKRGSEVYWLVLVEGGEGERVVVGFGGDEVGVEVVR